MIHKIGKIGNKFIWAMACDKCGHSLSNLSKKYLIESSKERGWVSTEKITICPECN